MVGHAMTHKEAKDYYILDEPFARTVKQLETNQETYTTLEQSQDLLDNLDACKCSLKRDKCTDNAYCKLPTEQEN
jgi:hypothetical protein